MLQKKHAHLRLVIKPIVDLSAIDKNLCFKMKKNDFYTLAVTLQYMRKLKLTVVPKSMYLHKLLEKLLLVEPHWPYEVQ